MSNSGKIILSGDYGNISPSSVARIRGKMARTYAGIDRTDIVCLGTSLTVGYGSTAGKTQSWPSVLANILANEGYTVTTGLIPAVQYTVADSRVTTTSGWTNFNTTNSLVMQGQTANNTITFADNRPSTTIDIYYLDTSEAAISWTYAVDGGTATTVNSISGATTRRKITISGLSNTNHTVVITPTTGVTGSAPLYIIGVNFYSANSIAIHNLGISGATLSTTGGPLITTTVHSPLSMAIALAPSLSFIEYGTNEGTSFSASTFQGFIQNAITNLQGVNSDIVLIGESPYSSGYRPIVPALAVMESLANTYNCSVISWVERLVSYSSANAQNLYYTDGLHLNEAGYAELARANSEIFS